MDLCLVAVLVCNADLTLSNDRKPAYILKPIVCSRSVSMKSCTSADVNDLRRPNLQMAPKKVCF